MTVASNTQVIYVDQYAQYLNLNITQGKEGYDTCTVSARMFHADGTNTVIPRIARTDRQSP